MCVLGGGSLTMVGQVMFARLTETQIWYPPRPAGVVGGLSKGIMAPASIFLLERAAPPTLALKTDNSTPSLTLLARFKLLSLCWILGCAFVSE